MSWSLKRYCRLLTKNVNYRRNISLNTHRFTQTNSKFSSSLNIGPAAYLEVLQEKFGHENFKPYQLSVIQSVIENKRDNYVCLPTGYGKSLCYQFPAVFLNQLTIVISPLISLMQDQIRSLEKNNIKSCFIAKIQNRKNEIVKELFNEYYNLLYITPESITNSIGLQLLTDLYNTVPISLIAVDEAQCILHWGKDFRPSFKRLKMLRSYVPSVPIMALTASATNDERDVIISQLNLQNAQEIHHDYDRKNLYFIAKPMTREPYGDIINIIKEEAPKLKISKGSIIIYCLTKRSTIKIARLLNDMDISCEVYHADLNAEKRTKILNDFMDDEIKIIVATTAFGLGVNKKDVRIVIHYGASLNLENYFQEVGRAGRDDKQSLCVLFYSVYDFFIHRYLNNSKKSINFGKSLDDNETYMMKKYVQLSTCRRQFILSHFQNLDYNYNENFHKENCCDNCTANLNFIERKLVECTNETELFLKAIESIHPKTYGIKTIISLLLGLKKKYLVETLGKNKYYGLGGNKDEEWWKNLALMLETENYIKITMKMANSILYSKAVLDKKGKEWLKSKSKGAVKPLFIRES